MKKYTRWTYPCWINWKDLQHNVDNSYPTKMHLFDAQSNYQKICNCNKKHKPIKLIFVVEIEDNISKVDY